MSNRRKRKSWSDDEKREICQQTLLPGFSMAQVPRGIYPFNGIDPFEMTHNIKTNGGGELPGQKACFEKTNG
ncbi:MAG: hypothetical protein ABJ327_13070 [Litoreibacter sp.]